MKLLTTISSILFLFIAQAQLSGTYTIDNSLPTKKSNFNNIKDAINTVKLKGLDGDATFLISPGYYYEPMVFDGVNQDGQFSAKFQPATASDKVVFENDGIAVLMVNSNGIVLNNLEFSSISARMSSIVSLENSNNVKVKDCNILTKDFSNKDNYLVSISNTSKNNTFVGNTLVGYNGFLITKLSNNTSIESNHIYFDNIGIDVQSSQDLNVFANTMQGNQGIAKKAVIVDGFVGNIGMASNAVSNVELGLTQTLTWRPSDSKLSGKVINNVFECQESAIYLTNNVDGLKIDFNSFTAHNGSVILIDEEIKNTISNIDIIANNLVSHNGYMVLNIDKSAFVSNFDYNNIYNHNKSFNAFIDGQSVKSIDEWKALTGAEHSISADPKYVEVGNAKYIVAEDSPCINAGPNAVNIGVITDYDGDLRGEVTEIGADEFNKMALENIEKAIELATTK